MAQTQMRRRHRADERERSPHRRSVLEKRKKFLLVRARRRIPPKWLLGQYALLYARFKRLVMTHHTSLRHAYLVSVMPIKPVGGKGEQEKRPKASCSHVLPPLCVLICKPTSICDRQKLYWTVMLSEKQHCGADSSVSYPRSPYTS